MSKLSRRIVALGALSLILALVFSSVPASSATPLTGGNFTYVINGEESVQPFDPIVKKDGLLLPVDAFSALGITVSDAQTKTVTVKRGGVSFKVTLGQPWLTLADGTLVNLAPVPLRVSGRVFLPVQVMNELGVDVQADTSIITLRDLAATLPDGSLTNPADYATAKAGYNISGLVRSAESPYLNIDVTYLTPALVASPNLVGDYGVRARLIRLLETNTLALVHVKNTLTTKALTFTPASVSLIDNLGGQYDFTGTAVDLQGAIASKVGPGVDKYTVLVFGKVNPVATNLTVYLDSNSGTLGTISLSAAPH